MDADGIPEARVTARDMLRSRYPRDTIDDEEAITEQMSEEEPFARAARIPTLPSPTPPSARPPRRAPQAPLPVPPPNLPPRPEPSPWIAAPPPMSPRPLPIPRPNSNTSLSPMAVARRSSHPPTPSQGSRPSAYARRAARNGPRVDSRTFFARAPSAPWILALITLGGVTAFTTVVATRSHVGSEPSPRAPRAAAAAPESAVDAGADAAVEHRRK
jgi:hypothetical protein